MTASPDTIVAVATASGRGGIGVVRISGEKAAAIGERIFAAREKESLPWPSHRMIYGRVIRPGSGEVVDDGLAVRMPSPHSYTGEEVVEIQVHGSPVILGEIVSLCLSLGARLAAPGEFTKRAFLNGRMDLIQAEAVAELIRAESEAEAESARRRLDGKLSEALLKLREETVSLLAECEADIDFPDEALPIGKRPTTIKKIKQIQELALVLRKTYGANRRLQGGFRVAIMGRPNVGKSSLFNALLQVERAIVTQIPGTTRDVLREELILGGRRIRLIDTAGLRVSTQDPVEKIGIERAGIEAANADVICLLGAADEGFTAEDKQFVEKLPKKKLWWVWNKVDQKNPGIIEIGVKTRLMVSALRGDGVPELREALGSAAAERSEVSSEGGIANDRQKELLDAFIRSFEKAEAEWRRGASPEFVAFELRAAHRALSRLVGKDEGNEDILNEIFSRFCIGK